MKMNRLIIIGASGHGKVVADIAIKCGYKDIIFLDNNTEIKNCSEYRVLGTDDMATELSGDIFVAIGNSYIRKRLMSRYKDRNFPTLIHPNSVIADDVQIGFGTVVMPGVVINAGAQIGHGVIVNTCSSIDHDCIINDYSHISVGAHLSGTVMIGENTWIGAGATVINNISICDNCMIGAGAVVVKDIIESGTYIGVPACIMNK